MSNQNQTKNIQPENTFPPIITNKWSLHVISMLGTSTKRYNEVKRSSPIVTQKVLTETLRRLERNGIVERTQYPTIPPQVEYKLTALGLELFELSKSVIDWVRKHEPEIKRAQYAYDRRKQSKLP